MRGKLAVQHYTGSVINISLDVLPNLNSNTKARVNITPQPQTYASIVRKSPQSNQKSRNSQAQPQLGEYLADNMSGQQGAGSRQYKKKVNTGTANYGGNYHQYNVQTKNRFSFPASGN